MSVMVDRELLHTSDDYAAHVDCVMPAGMRTGWSRFGGTYIATCDRCGYVCAYWECVCELAHDCGGAA